MESREHFNWTRHPEVEAVFLHYLELFSGQSRFLADLSSRLLEQTSAGLLNWVDHILLENSEGIRHKLDALGFERQNDAAAAAYSHPGSLLPSIVLVANASAAKLGVALRVESLENFSDANSLKLDPEGPALSPYRRALATLQDGVGVWIVERRGSRGFDPVYPEEGYLRDYKRSIDRWEDLPRETQDEEALLDAMMGIAGDLVAGFGEGPAADIVCLYERDRWLSKNSAGRFQKERQDTLGLGWANQDHHTYRSSRRNFSKLINLFLRLGFEKRERFDAGEEAGWGAQVMDHPSTGLALFLDVDLAPEEIDIDFSTRELEELETLGTVGLWCALHGDSILEAGLHHLAARFEFERLIEDLAVRDIHFMAPFSNFSYLKQAFSLSETWQVEPSRIKKLLNDKHIDEEQAERFLNKGSVGSHIENIERRDGYKGFNKENVSSIIRDTDPRK